MKRRSDQIVGWLNLRTLVLLGAVLLLTLPQRPAILGKVDHAVFQLGGSLTSAAPPAATVAVVELPDAEVNALINDAGAASQTRELLARLIRSNNLIIGIVLPTAPRSFDGLNQLRSLPVSQLGDGESAQALKSYIDTAYGLGELLNHPRVVVGVLDAASVPAAQSPDIAVTTDPQASYLDWLPMRPRLPLLPTNPGAALTPAVFHVDQRNDLPQSLMYQTGERVVPGFLLQLFARFNRADDIVWQRPNALQVGTVRLPLSADGSFVAGTLLEAGGKAISFHSLQDAIDNRIPADLVLLGPGYFDGLPAIANAFLSLDNQFYYRTPAWFALLEPGLLVLIALYLIVLLPRLAPSAGVFASCLWLVILLVMQLGWQLTQRQWLPLGVALQFLLAGHLLIFIWRAQHDKSLQLQAAAHGARYQLGLQLFRDGRGDDALLAIRECFTSDAVLNLMYDIASQQERKRHYNEAVNTYQAIVARRKHFKDAAQKVEKLISFASSGASSLTNPGEVAKTLIISEATIQKPVLGRYEIERELGRGAMGVVYLGRDPKIARHVAIKTLSYAAIDPGQLDEFKERFFREAEAAGRLSHPNIVTIYDVGEEHDLAFIAMDYIKGRSLSAHTDAETLLPDERIYQIIAQVADALHYAHSKQIIHRDIKPGNIMYEPESGNVKVTDFGIARMADSARTSTGDILGSPLYMSPEQMRGGRVTQQSDIFSLGVTLYQLLTGALPFSGDSMAALSYNIIHEKHRGVRDLRPDLPPGLTRIINKALQKEPEKRFASAADMADALRRATSVELG